MRTASLRIFLVLTLLIGLGINNSVWAEQSSETPSPNIKVEQWIGNVFTFIALPADKQVVGYRIFTEDQAIQGFEGDNSLRIPYKKYVGKEVTVTEVEVFPDGYNLKEYVVHMKVNDTGEKLVGRTVGLQLEGLVLTADLNKARQQFLGKVVYPKFRELSGLYVPVLNTAPSAVVTKIGGPVTVVDVYAGIQSKEPIWLIVSVDGEKAILPIAYSWTNLPIQCWDETPAWQESLFTENPRVSLGGSRNLWEKIENGDIEKGMTKGHVYLSWGKPPHDKVSDSVWIYGTKKLSFNGDVLISIETISKSK